jgi:hypothetical protein
MVGTGSGLIKAICHNFSGGAEENRERNRMIAGVQAGIRTEYLPNTL